MRDRTGDDHADREPSARLHRALQHEPLAEETGRRRHADHAQCADGKCGHRPRHLPADAVELADLGLVGRRVDTARRKKSVIFATA